MLKMVTAITGRAVEGGRTSKMAGLESTDVTRMPAALPDISGNSITLAVFSVLTQAPHLQELGYYSAHPPKKKSFGETLVTAVTW